MSEHDAAPDPAPHRTAQPASDTDARAAAPGASAASAASGVSGAVSGGQARVAFQGEHGAFSEEAAVAAFGTAAVTVPERDFAGVAHAVLSGVAEYGVLPAENLIHGSVMPVYDLLAAGGLTIIGEVVHPIRLCLMATPGVTLAEIRTVISHPVALNQCTRFFRRHPGLEARAFFDTAGAAREVAERRDPHTAAAAPAGAARRYGLDILAESIGDRPDNQTRFFIVRPDDGSRPETRVAADEPCRVVIMVDTPHQPGSLLRVLSPLADSGINLTRIESRPGAVAWSYHFFVEAAAPDRHALLQALAGMEQAADRIVLLGVMPAR
jgi:prephenate dehydratase